MWQARERLLLYTNVYSFFAFRVWIERVNLWAIIKTTMGEKSVETLGSKIRFSAFWKHFPPFPQKQCWFFYFFDCADYSAYTTSNWGAGGIRDLTLDANKPERILKYQKSSFPKSVSTLTTFVAHCLEAIYAICCDFLYISKLQQVYFYKSD